MSAKSIVTMQRRDREIRDVFNKLKKTYSNAIVQDFFERHYFLSMNRVYAIVSSSDDEPVTTPSIIHSTVMDPNFKI